MTRAKRNGQVQRVTLQRQAVLRRPDRLYIKTAGDMNNEIWYDGVGLTVVMHKDKVFAQAPMPKTLDKTLDAMHERYGVATPLGDFAYSSPAKALLSDTTKGGWVGRETIDGQPTDHVSRSPTRASPGRSWIPATGDPLPKKGFRQVRRRQALREGRARPSPTGIWRRRLPTIGSRRPCRPTTRESRCCSARGF